MPPLLPRKIGRKDSVVDSRLLRPSPSVHQVGIVFFSGECPAGQIVLVHIDEFVDGEWHGAVVEG